MTAELEIAKMSIDVFQNERNVDKCIISIGQSHHVRSKSYASCLQLLSHETDVLLRTCKHILIATHALKIDLV